jgi:hypothetical protein
LYVNVALLGPEQYCSFPALHASQSWQLLTMQPTPTVSPQLKRVEVPARAA